MAIVLAALCGGVVWLVWPRDITPISESEAVAEFREAAATGATPDARATDIPKPGVYRYAATGTERVKFSVLPAQVRPIPAVITALVTDANGECFAFTINYFAEHTEDMRYCATRTDELRRDRERKHQTVSAVATTSSITCTPTTIVRPRPGSHPVDCRMTLAGAPIDVNLRLVGRIEQHARRSVRLAGTTMPITPVTLTFDVTGDLHGQWTESLWFSDTHLPVRIDRDLALDGVASFSEDSTITLQRSSPAT